MKKLNDATNMNKEPLVEMFIFETNQLIEQLEEILIESEEKRIFSSENINEIFRIMHTIKGSSAMMMFDNISSLAHRLEDLFYFIREKLPPNLDYSFICDLVLISSDFIKFEISKIASGKAANGNGKDIIDKIKTYLEKMSNSNNKNNKIEAANKIDEVKDDKDKQIECICKCGSDDNFTKYSALVFFEDGCQMENIRAYTIVNSLKELSREVYYIPENLEDNLSADIIVENGFNVYFSTDRDFDELKKIFEQELFVKSYELKVLKECDKSIKDLNTSNEGNAKNTSNDKDETFKEGQSDIKENLNKMANVKQSLISVNVTKLDKLMDLVGEIVITESMVTRNPDLNGLELDNFSKAARQLRKLTDELQDTVMSIRMIPVSATFKKMHRIVRDMGKKLNKEVELILSGEDTEVDKNIIDHLSDPLMHLIRNAMDHGIESENERIKSGKDVRGRIRLGASNAGGEVVITVEDDGRGLDKDKIFKKAKEKGLVIKTNYEYTDREIFSFILLPGFSTKEAVTEFSGRGVGMDVVKKNIEQVGGSIFIDSKVGIGTKITIKIPLTLAIVDGMEVLVGNSIYTIPIISIRKSFKPDKKDIIRDVQGNEMIMIRGNCYPVIRAHRLFNIETTIKNLDDGIVILIEGNEKSLCLFVDKLIGEQQVVVKPLPAYLMKYKVKGSGIGGCTILGDGSISLILDVNGIMSTLI